MLCVFFHICQCMSRLLLNVATVNPHRETSSTPPNMVPVQTDNLDQMNIHACIEMLSDRAVKVCRRI